MRCFLTDLLRLQDYSEDSLQNIFSSTKVITSLVIAMLADRGHLRYDQRIAELWPDFAQNGKEGITVADLMRHEAGLAEFDFAIPLDNITTQALKAGKLSGSIASQKPKWRNNSRRQYHSLTRGLIANEIVMRADPQQRTIGEFVAQEIAGPLRCALTILYHSHTIVCALSNGFV